MRSLAIILGVSMLALAAAPVAAAQDPVDYVITLPGVHSGDAKGPYTIITGPGLVVIWGTGNVGFEDPLLGVWGVDPASFEDPLLGYERTKGAWAWAQGPRLGFGLGNSGASFDNPIIAVSPSHGADASAGSGRASFEDPLLGFEDPLLGFESHGASVGFQMPDKVVRTLP